ncbi:MAG: UvrD-helicase domain-containing protein [Clostridiales bacterium]|nr:UvrD-helicase domain-containing protein [Clostridiales bacterium]
MYDFGNANEAQREAISTVDGPVLITAGPGTGKTFTVFMENMKWSLH